MIALVRRRSGRSAARSVHPFSLLAAALACVSSAAAQEPVQELAPVVVTASRLPQTLPDALPHTTVLRESDIRNSGAVDLPALLKREAGVEFAQSGGVGSPSSLFLRGAESRHVVVLVDGVRLNSETVGGTAIEHIALDQIERIEIVRGNVSAVYGSGAVGGVVQIFTKAGLRQRGASVSVMGGSRGTGKLSLGYAGAAGDTTYAVNASHLRTRGISSVDTAIFANDNPDRDGYRNDSLTLQAAHRLATGHTVGLRVYGTEGEVDYDNGGNFGSPTDDHRQRSSLAAIALHSENRFAENWLSRVQVSLGREAARFELNGAFAGRYYTRHQQLEWQNEVELGAQHTLTAHLEADRQTILADFGFPPVLERARTLSGAGLGYLGTIGAHELQANVRYDHTNDFGSATTGLLGYGYQLSKEWKLLAVASSAFTAPNLGQLYSAGFGNPALQAERARSVELGASHAVGAEVLRATLFRNRIDHQIDFDLATFQYMNLKRVRNTGLEVSYSGRIGPAEVRASLTHQNPEDADTGDRLARRARTFGSIVGTLQSGPWTYGVDVYSSARRPDAGQTLGAYTVLDLRLGYRFDKALSALLKIENVTDKRYQSVYGYNQNPRGAFLTLNWQP